MPGGFLAAAAGAGLPPARPVRGAGTDIVISATDCVREPMGRRAGEALDGHLGAPRAGSIDSWVTSMGRPPAERFDPPQ